MKKVLFSLFLFTIFLFSVFGENSQSEKKSNDNLGFSAQLAISNSDYMVTVGDFYRLTYSISGNMISYEILVDSTYDIRIGNLGVIKAKGKSYISLKKEVEELVLRNFPMSGVQFVLVSPAVFTVKITGEVNSAKEKKVWGLTRVSEAISNSLTEYSSTRNIKIKAENGKVKVIDLFKARRDGDLSNDPYVRPGDEIIVQRMDRKVTIVGEVERPGTYELLPGENLKELVEKYGNGLTEFANTEKIGLVRHIGSETKSGDKIYIDESAITQNYKLNNGDSIEVTSLKTLMPTIIVEGIIANPKAGEDSAETAKKGSAAPLDTSYKTYVRFYTGENYATLIRRISGMFNSYSDLKNAYIVRNGERISLDIEHILYDAELMSDKTVMANDRLVIPYQQHLQKVLITGEVNKVVEENAWPLRRLSAIIGDNLTPYSSTRNVIVRTVEGTESVYDLFEASRNGDLAQNPYIRSGETIIVQRMERKVSISGEVERPGTYELLPGENLKELVEKYGNGLTEFADLSRIEIFRVKSENSVSGQMMYLNAQDLEDEVLTTFDVQCYDSVTVMSFKNLKPVVFIEGAVLSDTNKSGTELLSSNKLSINFEIDTNYAFFVRSNRKIFSSVSDLKNAYIKRGQDIIPIDLEKILYDKSYYSELVVENGDTLLVPFRQFFVTVSGAVNNPGRYPYIPDRTYEYYVGLAGGFIKSQNSGEAVSLTDSNGKHFNKKTFVPPEAMIEAKTNSFLYYFNQVGGVVTTLMSIILSTISIFVAVVR